MIGLKNYETAFFKDSLFWKSVERTILWSVTSVPLGVVGSFIAALLLNRDVNGTTAWRISFFLPSLTPQVAASLLWMWLLQPDIGLVNGLIRMVFGIKGPPWMASTQWAMPSLLLISLWSGIGSNRMLIFLAGLQGVPRELYDAAIVDGANWAQKIWHITVPMISPTIFFNLVLGIIGSFQYSAWPSSPRVVGLPMRPTFMRCISTRRPLKSFDMAMVARCHGSCSWRSLGLRWFNSGYSLSGSTMLEMCAVEVGWREWYKEVRMETARVSHRAGDRSARRRARSLPSCSASLPPFLPSFFFFPSFGALPALSRRLWR